MYPKLLWKREALRQNVETLDLYCQRQGLQWIAVTKGFCAHLPIVETLVQSGMTHFADSKWQHIHEMKERFPNIHVDLIRIPTREEVPYVVGVATRIVVTSYEVAHLLNEEAKSKNIIQPIIVFIELGDRREGISQEKAAQLLKRLDELTHIQVAGVGMNVTCFNGVVPDEEKMQEWASFVERLPRKYDVYSGGSSSVLQTLWNEKPLPYVTELRIGEALLFGVEASYGEALPKMRQDVFELHVQVVEVEWKEERPSGTCSARTFQQEVRQNRDGLRKRVIIHIGAQDVAVEAICPVDPNIEIIGWCSDYTILDVTDCQEDIDVHSIITFHIQYAALLRLTTSPYVTIEEMKKNEK